jgi:thymidine kinase
LREFCEYAANRGLAVIVSALDGTYKREPFGKISHLICLAESVTKLNAICMVCQKEASFTKRINEETETVVIGGQDKYLAVCRKCFNMKK